MPEQQSQFVRGVRIGTFAEKRALLAAADSVELLVLNANLVSWAVSAATSLVSSELDIPYVIDPISYAFRLHRKHLVSEKKDKKTGKKTKELKRSFENLSKAYGPKLSEIIVTAGLRLTLDDLRRSDMLSELVEHTLKWEYSVLAEQFEADSKYGLPEILPRPEFLIAPYFFVPYPDKRGGWADLNQSLMLEACRTARAADYDRPLFGSLLLSSFHLDDTDELLRISRLAIDAGCDGYLYWFDDSDEYRLTDARLETYCRFVETFVESERSLINMYGGYPSILLQKRGLSGTFHGVNYWENKPYNPLVSFGIRPARYYFTPVHQRLRASEVEALLPEGMTAGEFHERICDCATCRRVIQDDAPQNFSDRFGRTKIKFTGRRHFEYAVPEALSLCQEHYLHRIAMEVEAVANSTEEQIAEALRESYETYADELDGTQSGDLSYLKFWTEKILGQSWNG